MQQQFIQIEKVEKKIDNFFLGPMDITIEPGTITALVGDNGSGKSTLLKMMMDLVNYDHGTINLFGYSSQGHNEDWKQFIAYQPQTVIGFDAFTGKDLRNLISHWYPNWDQKLFMKMVTELNVPLNKKFGKLSQGVQQKLTLALTIPRNAKVLILDEPTSFIDIPSKNIIIDLLVDWMEVEDRAILLASHQAEDIKKLADYIVLLRRGKMLGHFEKEALIEKYCKYWVTEQITSKIPGEVYRKGHEIISDRPTEVEKYFADNKITPMNSTAIELEEIITLLLMHETR